MTNSELEVFYKKIDIINDYNEYTTDTFSWYVNLAKLPLLTHEEEKILLHQISLGDKRARKILIERNLRLVISIALKYVNHGLPLLDIIQDGNIGLIKAVDNYKINEITSFSTYAYTAIENCIRRGIDEKVRMIVIPVNKLQEIKKYREKVRILSDKLMRNPSINEISKYLHININEVIEIEKINSDAVLINDLIIHMIIYVLSTFVMI